jgi:hypothetical protein
MDPYQHLDDIQPTVQRLCKILQVTEFEKILAPTGYCRILATVQLQSDRAMTKVGVDKYVELDFHYEREIHTVVNDAHNNKTTTTTTTVWYSIDVSRDNGPKEKVLWVKVFGGGPVPSGLPAKNIDEDNTENDDDDDDEWEDIDDDEECQNNEPEESEVTTSPTEAKKFKKARIDTGTEDKFSNENQCTTNEIIENEGHDDNDGEEVSLADHFTAGIDPEVLERFLHWSCLGTMEDDKAFFLLMSFNFYEMEYDLVGFILDAVFGPDEENESLGQEDD